MQRKKYYKRWLINRIFSITQGCTKSLAVSESCNLQFVWAGWTIKLFTLLEHISSLKESWVRHYTGWQMSTTGADVGCQVSYRQCTSVYPGIPQGKDCLNRLNCPTPLLLLNCSSGPRQQVYIIQRGSSTPLSTDSSRGRHVVVHPLPYGHDTLQVFLFALLRVPEQLQI